jgi:hypothetical protein
MESNGKPASKRQMAYIRRLQTAVGEDEPEISEEMSVSEASNLISELISRARRTGVVVQRQTNEPRLGMAMKECFRQWTALGKSIHDAVFLALRFPQPFPEWVCC